MIKITNERKNECSLEQKNVYENEANFHFFTLTKGKFKNQTDPLL